MMQIRAREATQPRVHFVELVGISSGEDVVSEVGAALGVRNSVSGRRSLTQSQLADVRGRIAQELDTVPTLLVLDNCEHVLDATATMIDAIFAHSAMVQVLATSREGLALRDERLWPVPPLDVDSSATALFMDRAAAAAASGLRVVGGVGGVGGVGVSGRARGRRRCR